MPIRVVKVGGSLLEWPRLGDALHAWMGGATSRGRESLSPSNLPCGSSLGDKDSRPLRSTSSAQQPILNVLICGGGPLCDAIRRADKAHALGEEAAHWLCVDLLSASARLLAAILRDIPLVDAIDPQDHRGAVIFDPRPFLYDAEPHLPGCVLPHNWSVTSDSIAARIAEVLAARELVLLKSADPPPSANAADLAGAGYVDAFFPAAAGPLAAVRYVNLRQTKRPG